MARDDRFRVNAAPAAAQYAVRFAQAVCHLALHAFVARVGKDAVRRAVPKRQVGAVAGQINDVHKRILQLGRIIQTVPFQNPMADVRHKDRRRPANPVELPLDALARAAGDV